MKDLFAELRRRHVFRVGGAYFVVAWLALQVVDVLVPLLEAPPWVGRTILLVLVAGLPIVLILAWAFDITSDGIKRTDESTETALQIKTSRRRNLDRAIVGGLAVAVAALDASGVHAVPHMIGEGVKTLPQEVAELGGHLLLVERAAHAMHPGVALRVPDREGEMPGSEHGGAETLHVERRPAEPAREEGIELLA